LHPGATSRFARLVVRLRFALVAGWVAAVVAAGALLPTLEEAQTGALGDLVPADSEAIDAEVRAAERFAFPLLSRTLLVQRDPAGLSVEEQARVVQRAAQINERVYPGLEPVAVALPVTNALGAPPFATERSTTAITFLRFPPDVGRRERERVAERLKSDVERREDHFVGVTGAIPARDAQSEAIQDALPRVELATVALVALAVGLHFRALLAPLVTLLAIAIAYLVSIRVLAGVGERLGISVPAEVEPVMIVLLFGIITDYAIFFLSRFRDQLAEGRPARDAAVSATAELQGIVLTAGLTVAGASAALVVAELGFFRAFGPGLAVAVLIALAVALTFLPACLAILGAALLWPGRVHQRPRHVRRDRPRRLSAVALAARRPWWVATVTTLVLLACGAGLTRLDVGQTLMRGLPPEAEARQAYANAGRGFAPGILAPTVLLLEAPGITQERAALARLQRAIAARPGVAEVVGPRDQPLQRELGAVLARDGSAARMAIVFRSDPLGAGAIERLRRLREDLPALVASAGLEGVRTSFAGDTALAEETVRKSSADLVRIAPAALLTIVATLVVFLRALVAPLYLVAASVLGLAAGLGLTTLATQELFGWTDITFFVPFAAAVLLVSLGSDYNVFLAGRIWQEARHRPLREAIAVAGARAAGAISVAGVVLALSFGLLALVPVRAFRELALAMSLGLLIDTFVVRTLLVPALIALVGDRSAWPGRSLARSLPAPGRAVPPEPGLPVAGAAPGSQPPPRPQVRTLVAAGLVLGVASLLGGRAGKGG